MCSFATKYILEYSTTIIASGMYRTTTQESTVISSLCFKSQCPQSCPILFICPVSKDHKNTLSAAGVPAMTQIPSRTAQTVNSLKSSPWVRDGTGISLRCIDPHRPRVNLFGGWETFIVCSGVDFMSTAIKVVGICSHIPAVSVRLHFIRFITS